MLPAVNQYTPILLAFFSPVLLLMILSGERLTLTRSECFHFCFFLSVAESMDKIKISPAMEDPHATHMRVRRGFQIQEVGKSSYPSKI